MAQLTKYSLNEVNRVAAMFYMETHIKAAKDCRDIWLKTFPPPVEQNMVIGIYLHADRYPAVIHPDAYPRPVFCCDITIWDAPTKFAWERFKETREASRY